MSIDEVYSLGSQSVFDKPIIFLQIPDFDLHQYCISSTDTIKNLINNKQSNGINEVFAERIIQILKQYITPSGKIDWLAYYTEAVGEFSHLNFECKELDEIADTIPDEPITRDYFGSACVSLLKKNICTIGDLRDYLSSTDTKAISGFGKKKFKHLFTGLLRLIKDYMSGSYVNSKVGKNETYPIQDGFKWSSKQFTRLNSHSFNLPIDCINLGKKSKHLNASGIITLGDLINEFGQGLRKFELVGRPTINLWLSNLGAISENITESGDIDWEGYCEDRDLTSIPSKVTITDGRSFLLSLPIALAEFTEVVSEPLESSILHHRISAPYKKRKTLEELGHEFGITRERVRQRESKLITQITDALIYDKYQFLSYRFNPNFSKYFQEIAFHFSEETEIHFHDFMSSVAEILNVEESEILPHIPVIISFLTGESIAPLERSVSKSLPSGLYQDNLPSEFDEISSKNIRLGKITDQLEDLGFITIRDLINSYTNDSLPFGAARKDKVYHYLNDLSVTLEKHVDGNQFWHSHAINIGLKQLPEAPITSTFDFLDNVTSTLAKIIERDFRYKNALDVYLKRTSKPLKSRPTIEKTALMIGGTYSSHVKRLETDLVRFLNDLLIEENFRYSSVFMMPEFMRYWREIYIAYKEAKMYFDDFEAILLEKWQAHDSIFGEKIDLLWTVCNIYPNGRNRQVLKPITMNKVIAEKPNLIKLKGFKKIF